MKRLIIGARKASAGKPLTLCCALVLLVLWSEVVSARDCPVELPVNTDLRSTPLRHNHLYTINVGSESRQVLLHWDDLPAVPEPAGQAPVVANQLIDRLETSLQAMQAQGFRIPPGGDHPCVSGRVFRIYLYQLPAGAASGGLASGNRFDVAFTRASAEQNAILKDNMPGLLQEMFYLVQAQYGVGAMSRPWLTRGTARLASEVFNRAGDEPGAASPVSCPMPLNADPFTWTFRRSLWGEGADACQAATFWQYLIAQLGTDRGEAGMGLIHELYEFLAIYRDLPVWKTAPTDRIHGGGDFDGDGREELLITSVTHLGLLASTPAQSRVVAVKAFADRLAGGWHLRSSDQILGIGDFNADGKDEFLVRNGGFLALLGIGDDGDLGAMAQVPLGSSGFADWRPRFRDQLIAIGDFDGDGAEEAMFRGKTRVGVIRLDASGQFVSPFSVSLKRLATHLGRHPVVINVIGVGDVDGNGRDEVVARDRRGLFVWGLNAQDRYELLFAADYGERLGDDWVLGHDDIFIGVSDLDGSVTDIEDDPGFRAEIVVTRRGGLAVIGVNGLSRRLEIKSVLDPGTPLSPKMAFGARTRVIAIGRFLGPAGHQLMLREANTLALLEYAYQAPGIGSLRTAATLAMRPGELAPMRQLRAQQLDHAKLEGRFNIADRPLPAQGSGANSVALAGREADYLVTRGRDRLLYIKAKRELDSTGLAQTRLGLEHRDLDGHNQKSVVQALDAFIRYKDPSRTLASMWHELSLMLLSKNLAGRLKAQSIGPDGQTDFLSSSFIGQPYSAQYFVIKPSSTARQVDLTYRNLTTHRWFDLPGHSRALPTASLVSTITVNGHQTGRVDQNPGRGRQDFDQSYRLAAGDWMGIVLSTTDAAHPHSLDVNLRPIKAAD